MMSSRNLSREISLECSPTPMLRCDCSFIGGSVTRGLDDIFLLSRIAVPTALMEGTVTPGVMEVGDAHYECLRERLRMTIIKPNPRGCSFVSLGLSAFLLTLACANKMKT